MRHAEVTLDDKFLLTEGRVFISATPPGGRSRLARLASMRWAPPVDAAGSRRTELQAHREYRFSASARTGHDDAQEQSGS